MAVDGSISNCLMVFVFPENVWSLLETHLYLRQGSIFDDHIEKYSLPRIKTYKTPYGV
jgi:hypothetical protein